MVLFIRLSHFNVFRFCFSAISAIMFVNGSRIGAFKCTRPDCLRYFWDERARQRHELTHDIKTIKAPCGVYCHGEQGVVKHRLLCSVLSCRTRPKGIPIIDFVPIQSSLPPVPKVVPIPVDTSAHSTTPSTSSLSSPSPTPEVVDDDNSTYECNVDEEYDVASELSSNERLQTPSPGAPYSSSHSIDDLPSPPPPKCKRPTMTPLFQVIQPSPFPSTTHV